MALRAVTGFKGSGKTCYTTARLCDAYQEGQSIYSNYTLEFPYHPLHMEDFIEDMMELENLTMAVDEAQLYFDCRMSSSKRNRLFSYMMLQSRKRHVDIVLTSQQLANLDIRIRRNLDYLYECVPMVSNGSGKYRKATVEEIEARVIEKVYIRETNYAQETVKAFLFDPSPYFALYNSDELCDIV